MKSMMKNAILMAIKTFFSLVMPLVTFPYVSRVLQVEAIGQYNFSNSIVSYFLLLAGLGISTYAIREGAKIRNDKEKIDEFVSEMYCINWISTLIALSLLVVSVVVVPKLHNYSFIIFILSFQLLFTVYGRTWIYNIYEDFSYITIVQILFQICAVPLIFLFVKKPEDIIAYTVITLFSTMGPNVFYGVHSNKYVSITRPLHIDFKKHMKPIVVIFSTAVATTIYVNSDITILGWLTNDETVGLYSTAVKIYNIVKQMLVAVITISIPRLTMTSQNKDEFSQLFAKVLNMLVFILLPSLIGLFLLSENAVVIIAGESYVNASASLKILSCALMFALPACLLGLAVLLPYNYENKFLFSTIVSAIVNVVLNIVMIPVFQEKAAAFTTALSQFVAFSICYHYAKTYINIRLCVKSIVTTLIGCVGIICVCCIVKELGLSLLVETISTIIISGLVYLLSQLVLKNPIAIDIKNEIPKYARRISKTER